MKNLITALFLSIVLLLGDAGISWSTDNEIIIKKTIPNTKFSFEITKKTMSNVFSQTIRFLRDGKEVLSKPAESSVDARTFDINGDQREEVLVTIKDGGNCCAPQVVLYFVDTQTNELKEFLFDEWQVWKGWDDVRINAVDNIATLTSTNNNDGRNTSLVRSDISYKFDGKKVDLFNTKKYTKIPALAELNASDFNGFENSFRKESYRINKVINLKFDLDSDGKNEEFYCPFWERWGLLNSCSIISEKYGNILKAPQCKRLGVLSEKKNGWHILVVDFNERWFFDLQSNQYQPITKRTKK